MPAKVGSHINANHKDLLFGLNRWKPVVGPPLYIKCSHCNYVTVDSNSGLHPSQLPAQLIGARESPSLPLQLTQQAFHAAEALSAATAQVQPTPSSSAEQQPSAGFQLDPIVAKQVVFNLVEQLQQGGLGVVNKLLALKFQIPPLLVALCPRHT